MKGLGLIVMLGSAAFLFFALSMNTSVSTGYGRVNNIGLMNDRQTYVIVSVAGLIIGLLMLQFGRASRSERPEAPGDPFDELERQQASLSEQATNDRKRYAIRLGVRRVNGYYVFDDLQTTNLGEAISYAEAAMTATEADAARAEANANRTDGAVL